MPALAPVPLPPGAAALRAQAQAARDVEDAAAEALWMKVCREVLAGLHPEHTVWFEVALHHDDLRGQLWCTSSWVHRVMRM